MNQTVLICDDTLFMRMLITRALTDAGFEVIGEASTGAEAVEQYRKLRPDLVTMDIVMPDMGGIDAVRAILDADEHATIVVCSAMSQQQIVDEATAAGVASYLVKPFDADQLVCEVTKAISRGGRSAAVSS